jgi:uncharacterized protein (TIGR03086 family)
MELLDAFDTALTEFDRLVHQAGPEQTGAPTPCAGWTVRDLLNHLVGEHLWAPYILGGATTEEVGDRFDGDVLGEDFVAAWEEAASGSREAFHRPGALAGTVHVSSGEVPAAVYGWQMTTDLAVHGWDLAVGIGAQARVPDALADALRERIEPQVAEWQGSGLFDPPVEPAPGASALDRLVALLGRDPGRAA